MGPPLNGLEAQKGQTGCLGHNAGEWTPCPPQDRLRSPHLGQRDRPQGQGQLWGSPLC